MRTTHLWLSPLLLSTLAWGQSEVLYYKFDEGGGTKVVNYASANALAPLEGTVMSTDVGAFVPGRFGVGALRGSTSSSIYTYIESGGIAALSGSFSVAWFMKARSVAPASTNYFFGSNTSGSLFRGYTGGTLAGTSLLVRNWGGTPADLKSATDIVTPALTNWVHIALVVDSVAATATFYVNGVADPAVAITGSTSVPALSTFRVNNYTSSAGASVFDMDEFRLLNRAASAAEVLAWSGRPSAADAKFGAGCGATLASTNGPPALGQSTYALSISGAPGALYLLALGTNRLMLGSVPLPLDLGVLFPSLAGCKWECSAEVTLSGTLSATGAGSQALPIPNVTVFEGAALWAQAFAVAGATLQSSNPFALGLGR